MPNSSADWPKDRTAARAAESGRSARGRCGFCWSARSCCRSRSTPSPPRFPTTSTSTTPATACAAISRSCTSTRRRCSRPSNSPRAISTKSTDDVTDAADPRERGDVFGTAARDDDVDAAIARPLDRRRRRPAAGVGHRLPDAQARSFGPQLFQGPSRQPGERPVSSARCWRRAPPTPASSPSAASARSTAGSPVSPSFRSRRNISANSIRSSRRPAPSALLRADGAVLARYPDFPARATQLPAERAVPDARSRRNRQTGLVTAPSAIDGRVAHLHLPAAGEAAEPLRRGRRRARRHHPRLDAGHGEPSDLRHSGDARAGRPRHHRAAPHRAPAAGGEPARSDRAGAASGAEDGGGRPAVGRHRARLQQHAHRHPRQHRHGVAPRRRATIRASSACSNSARQASERAATWCSACWRSPASIRRRSRRSTSTGWCRACRNCCAGPSAKPSPSKPCSPAACGRSPSIRTSSKTRSSISPSTRATRCPTAAA